MINRLADYLLAVNPTVKRALHQTYEAVFLDEFQDTTQPQYSFLRRAFEGSSAKFTAVGDDKQKIMGWAGALESAFEKFVKNFDAREINFLDNWRSHEDLVAVQHAVASQINGTTERPIAKREREVNGEVCGIWVYPDRKAEAEGVARWISEETNSGNMRAHEISILVRMRANVVFEKLRPAMEQRGLRLRNMSRVIEGVEIQILTAEELTGLVLSLLRLGCTRRHPGAWTSLSEELKHLHAVDDGDEQGLEWLSSQVGSLVREVRARLSRTAPARSEIEGLVRWIVDAIGEDRIRQAVPSYRRDADFKRVYRALVGYLSEAAEEADSWSSLLDDVEGIDQVSLMTVHKSKGLEFHTVIFHGLDTGSWASLRPGETEELNAFFVALTRAKQRAFFTSCTGRGQRIEWLEKILGRQVGVTEH